MSQLIDLIRNNHIEKFFIKYDVTFNSLWNDDELLSHITYLNCSFEELTELPYLSNCQELHCNHNKLTYLPKLPNCIKLFCNYNLLTSLSDLPKCEFLVCQNNKLTSLSQINNCKVLICYNNSLTSLPILNKCEELICFNNFLPFNDLNKFKKLWRFSNFYLSLKFFKLLYKKMLLLKAKRKYNLHLELKYSPDLHFYKEDPYYKHFIDSQQN